ncbi:hypothetical protein [Solitalea canadensis]|uniref:Calx-beta domain-containing protein n=1 Tax=Solitalea canadensis (strain ATCC 29591 / DSM 3403 / JCM 21819 / LMG 8368 / NBRC 15130 / NCIMB 12057 / USAM 9D) TaxID=929556 RepID=H8KX51_SOLCM|nr:hypothetical protein [Solitalea canadensis]AFD08380.1 hypothetical protein Solca_3373 [Solitalea canadensis DSM 3403]
MRKILFLFSVISVVLLQSCEKDSPGDNYEFTNTLPPYVTIQSLKTVTVVAGESATVNLQMRTSLQQKVTATYKVDGAIKLNDQTVVIERDKTTASISILVPAELAVGSESTLTLVKAVTESGETLTIGQDNVAANQKVKIVVK